ncbi:hypothetical protein LTR28_004993 [Elasticomyces elasticus]|nr:hypothetical protein LTR28_004993 [Elasticomyces elasticus]
MSTFSLPNSSPPCAVHLTNDLSEQQLMSFTAFKTWIGTLQHSLSNQANKSHTFHAKPYKLREIRIQSVDFFGGGKKLVLQPDDVDASSEDDKHVILTVQPRIPAGTLALPELPAGMLDDSGSFSGGAAKEIEEETGLKVEQDDLVDLTSLAFSTDPHDSTGERLQKAMYPSAGGCDEFVPLFLYQKRIPRNQLKEWQGKLTGLRDQGEKITLKVVPLKDLWKEGGRDSKALSAWALYEGLRREGRIRGPITLTDL